MTDPLAVIARIRQMTDYWEQHLPDVIRTPAVVSALRAALEPAAASAVVSPPTSRAAVPTGEDFLVAVEEALEATLLPTPGLGVLERTQDALMAALGPLVTQLRRLAAEAQHQPDTSTPASTAPLAAGLPLVKGNCPACRRASLFLGSGGYPTCANADCPEPDAATTVLEQYANEARPPQHAWRVETRDGEWVRGSHFLNRQAAVERYETANSTAPLWQDGTPVERRIVRETTTYTVEEPAAEQQQPVAVVQRAYPDCERCGDTGIDPEQDDAPCPECQQAAAADDEETP